jgi:hypothetical protein
LANWLARPVWHTGQTGPQVKNPHMANLATPLRRLVYVFKFHILLALFDFGCESYGIWITPDFDPHRSNWLGQPVRPV